MVGVMRMQTAHPSCWRQPQLQQQQPRLHETAANSGIKRQVKQQMPLSCGQAGCLVGRETPGSSSWKVVDQGRTQPAGFGKSQKTTLRPFTMNCDTFCG